VTTARRRLVETVVSVTLLPSARIDAAVLSGIDASVDRSWVRARRRAATHSPGINNIGWSGRWLKSRAREKGLGGLGAGAGRAG